MAIRLGVCRSVVWRRSRRPVEALAGRSGGAEVNVLGGVVG